ncbi:DUF459 domain-containing protein [Providencia sp. wls1919]|nr:DUF459 domain-containing protein [Providencia sp. wls1919]
MKKYLFIIILIVSGISSAKTLFLGDSLTYGISNQFKKNDNDLEVFYKVGSGLINDSHFWQKATAQIDFSSYDKVIIIIGTNDFLESNQYQKYVNNMWDFINNIYSTNKEIEIFWVLPPHLKDSKKNNKLKGTRAIISTVLTKWNIRYLDVNVEQLLGQTYMQYSKDQKIRTDDGIHLTDSGAKIIANGIKDIF